jgi:hypothetical protein
MTFVSRVHLSARSRIKDTPVKSSIISVDEKELVDFTNMTPVKKDLEYSYGNVILDLSGIEFPEFSEYELLLCLHYKKRVKVFHLLKGENSVSLRLRKNRKYSLLLKSGRVETLIMAGEIKKGSEWDCL